MPRRLAFFFLSLGHRAHVPLSRALMMPSRREMQKPMASFLGGLGATAVKKRRRTMQMVTRAQDSSNAAHTRAKLEPQASGGGTTPAHAPSLTQNSTSQGWSDLCVPAEELRPASTLLIGQCFNWRQAAADCWVGVLGRDVVAIRQTPRTTLFRRLEIPTKDQKQYQPATADALAAKLRAYFFLGQPLAPLYQQWSDADPRMAAVAASIPGVRVVRQDPVECIFSFICSSNNNIPRITLMLDKLRHTYGERVLSVGTGGLAATGLLENTDADAELQQWARAPLDLYSFPTVEALASQATDIKLREMGFGYRAKYIVESAKLILDKGGEEWALSMRKEQRDAVRDQLVSLSGVGPKVADCVALFSLDQAACIPVDVHVWRIACRDYDPSLRDCKSLTPTVYTRVGGLFRERFGERAGWAHSLLFAAELPGFKSLLSPGMQREMEDFRREERDSKAAAKANSSHSKEAKTQGARATGAKLSQTATRKAGCPVKREQRGPLGRIGKGTGKERTGDKTTPRAQRLRGRRSSR